MADGGSARKTTMSLLSSSSVGGEGMKAEETGEPPEITAPHEKGLNPKSTSLSQLFECVAE